jgi:hypothetical protein
MLKMIGGVLLSLAVAGLGIYFTSIYVTTRQEGSSPVLVGIGGAFIAAAVYCLILTIKSRTRVNADLSLMPQNNGTATDSGSILQKNNDMINDYNKTANTRDKLKVLEAAGAAEEK